MPNATRECCKLKYALNTLEQQDRYRSLGDVLDHLAVTPDFNDQLWRDLFECNRCRGSRLQRIFDGSQLSAHPPSHGRFGNVLITILASYRPFKDGVIQPDNVVLGRTRLGAVSHLIDLGPHRDSVVISDTYKTMRNYFTSRCSINCNTKENSLTPMFRERLKHAPWNF